MGLEGARKNFAGNLGHGAVEPQRSTGFPRGIGKAGAGLRRVGIVPVREEPVALFPNGMHGRDALDLFVSVGKFAAPVDREVARTAHLRAGGDKSNQSLQIVSTL